MRVVVINPLSKESCRWWNCGGKAYNEWTQEGWIEILRKLDRPGASPVTKEAYMTVYDMSGAMRNLGGTTEINGLCLYYGTKTLYLK